ncbi:MAG TPA: hypothetical protein VL588_08585 [Bdellovibrionota bacterium]|jgi:hypothetical protein|nr:hypothetical protein [Bdellovibrionota bacterium]
MWGIRKITFSVLAATVSLTLSGCLTPDPMYLATPGWNPNGGTSFGATGAGSTNASGFTCPGYHNVVPDFDQNLDGTEFWDVCYSATDKAQIQISGSTSNDPSVCVYPVQIIDSAHVMVKQDLSTGGLLKQCVYASTSDGHYAKTYYDWHNVSASFAATNYNAVIITKSTNQAQMDICLNGPAGPDYYACPAFSFGRFRQ